MVIKSLTFEEVLKDFVQHNLAEVKSKHSFEDLMIILMAELVLCIHSVMSMAGYSTVTPWFSMCSSNHFTAL